MITCCRCKKECPYAECRAAEYQCYECTMMRRWARAETKPFAVVTSIDHEPGFLRLAKPKRRPAKVGDRIEYTHRVKGKRVLTVVELDHGKLPEIRVSDGAQPISNWIHRREFVEPGGFGSEFFCHEDGTLIAFPGVTYDDV